MRTTLKNILESSVKLDNMLMWDGQEHPFFESYTIKLDDPIKKWALWLRYEIINPSSNKTQGKARISAGHLDSKGHKLTLKEEYELSKHDIVHADQFISITDSSLSLAQATGCVQNNKDCIKWEFKFEDPVISLRNFANKILYHLSYPKTKFVSPRLKSFATGQIYINHQKHELDRLKVYQNHQYSTGLLQNWARAHCIDFEEDDEAYFEAVGLYPKFKGQNLKPLHFFSLQFEGMTFNANGLTKMIFNRSQLETQEWNLEFQQSGYRFIIKIQRDPRNTFGSQHMIQNEPSLHLYHCPASQIQIKIFKQVKGQWVFEKTLTSTQGASFETACPQELAEFDIDLVWNNI